MNYQYLQEKKSKLAKLYRRVNKTEPIGANDQDQKVIEAKLYLLNLTKDNDLNQSLHKHKLFLPEQSLSQWNTHQDVQLAKIAQQLPAKGRKHRQTDRKIQQKLSNNVLSNFETELIKKENYKPISDRLYCNLTELSKRYQGNKTKINTVGICTREIVDQVSVTLSKKRLKQTLKRHKDMDKKDRHTNVCPTSCIKRSAEPRNWVLERQESQRLPKLERMSPENFKKKYKSIFRHNTHIKYSMPLQSPIGREINRISDLIDEQNILLSSNYYRR